MQTSCDTYFQQEYTFKNVIVKTNPKVYVLISCWLYVTHKYT